MLERIFLVALTPLALAGGTATSWLQLHWQLPAAPVATSPGRAASPAAGRLRIVPGSDGMLHTVVQINGEAIDMVVDTGASRTILSRQDAQRVFPDAATSRHTRIRTFGGDRDLSLRLVTSVNIDGQELGQLEAGTLDDAQVSVIGLDWLSRVGPITIGTAS